MAILVDDATWPWRGRRWAHLISDESYDELHRFARHLGLRREWFQGDHYDIPAHVRAAALVLGAVPVDSRQLVRRLRLSGLRYRPARAPTMTAGPGDDEVNDEADHQTDHQADHQTDHAQAVHDRRTGQTE